MKRLSLALAAAAVVFAASTPAQADFQIIRWTTGLCETWNMGIPTRPFPWDYKVVSKRNLPTFQAAVAAKMDLVKAGVCTF
jgi:hypothetical protein